VRLARAITLTRRQPAAIDQKQPLFGFSAISGEMRAQLQNV
jgi:hypothetical protein